MPTPHNAANDGDIAKTVLMPGDPLRAKHLAENYLEGAELFNGVRGMLGYTGLYRGKRISVMGSGMGIPSIGIYSYELYKYFGVESVIRIGSAGGLAEGVKLRDIVIAQGACTDSNFAAQYGLPGSFAPIADFGLLETAVKSARGICGEGAPRFHVGNVISCDAFYGDDSSSTDKWRKMGVLAIEMEAAGLYMTAARLGKRAIALLTVSDIVSTGEESTADERQTSFTQMMDIALETALLYS